MIRSICVIAFALACILVIGGPLLLYTLLSGNSDPIYRVGVFGAKLTVRLAGVRIEVSGRENILRTRAVVFMANHQSNADPPLIIGLLPPVLILTKEEFFAVPVLGRAMRLRGFIPVDRRNREKAIRAVNQAAEALAAGKSFLVFPEGTRSEDGRLLPFKKGVFRMAAQAGAPIVPASISGSRKIMPKGRAAIRPGRVRVTFHDPVMTEGKRADQIEEIQAAVRNAILSGLTKEEWPLEIGAMSQRPLNQS
ncbi:MAG: lysophospholipid acyltransferase family protein [Terriglobia bacterium]